MCAVPGSRARWVLAAAASVALLATAARAEETTPAGPAAAAWYPTGVGTVAAPTRPEGSLHVGAALGQETDRTYLRFDLGSLPEDAEVSGVAVTIPVDPEAGTSSPETATILACAVPGGFDPAATEPAPVDCEGAPEATLAGDAPSFTVSLEAPPGASTVDVALVPAGGETWHVGFDGPDGDAPPVAVASYDVPPAVTTTTAAPRPAPAAPSSPGIALPGPGVPVALPITVPPPAAAGRVVAGEAALSPPSAVTAVPAGGSTGFRYAAVFGLPLALLIVVGVAGDGLTRPVRLREESA